MLSQLIGVHAEQNLVNAVCIRRIRMTVHSFVFSRLLQGFRERLPDCDPLFSFYKLALERFLHNVKLFYVSFLELHSLFAGVTHCQKGEAVAGNIIHRIFFIIALNFVF